MKVAVSAQGPDLSSPVDPRFGRAAFFIIYDMASHSFEALGNSTNAGAAQGAGIQAAQLVARQAVDIVVSGNMGPKAFEALRAAGVKMVTWDGGTVAEAIEFIQSGEFEPLGDANVGGHWQ